jgi:hypothetical protein
MNHIVRTVAVLLALSTTGCTPSEVDRSRISDTAATCFVLRNTLRAHGKTLDTLFPEGGPESVLAAPPFQQAVRRLGNLIDDLSTVSADSLPQELADQISAEAGVIRLYLHSNGREPRAAFRRLADRLDRRAESSARVADEVQQQCGPTG